MLSDLRKIENDYEDLSADELRRAANILMEKQFLYFDHEHGRKTYQLIAPFGTYFKNLFDALNHEFIHDQEVGMIGIVPRGRTQSSFRVKKDEAFLLLAMRMVYEEAAAKFDLNNGNAMTSSERLLDVYKVHARSEDKPSLTDVRRTINLFKSHGVLDSIEDDDRVVKFRLRPAIRIVTNESWLKTLELFAGIAGDADTEPNASDTTFEEADA